MEWQKFSPDLNLIEHVWDMLDQRVAARQPPPTCVPELGRVLLAEWSNLPQDQHDTSGGANLGAALSPRSGP